MINIIGILPGVDILINNAGALINKPFENLNEEDFDLLDVNVKLFQLIQALFPT
ncbi:MAG: SDR family NAD(P)-dependent oxidoreductase [Bacteroidales bacterium]